LKRNNNNKTKSLKENKMKGLNKLVLVSAISAASFGAQAELKALDDTMMGELTGQAGLTIELETQVDIGKVTYTDEGSLEMSAVHIGGWGGSTLDDLLIDIDIEADGDAVIDVHSITGNPIDFNISVGTVALTGATDSTTLASNINMNGLLSQLNIRVDTATDTLIATVGFSIEDLDMDVDFLAVGIKDVSVHGVGYVAGTTTAANAENYAGVVVTVGSVANARAASGTALNVGLSTFAADVNIGAIEIGGTSIGSVNLDNLVVSNTSLQVYGH